MFEAAGIAFATLFATISPIEVGILFTGLAPREKREQRSIALKGTLIALSILSFFAFFGQALLSSLGITLSSLRTAGGILLLLMGIDRIFANKSRKAKAAEKCSEEEDSDADITVFPLAMPIIAGPGSIGAVVLLMAESKGVILTQSIVMMSLVFNILLAFIFCLIGGRIQKFLGKSVLEAFLRIIGLLIMALAVQFIFDGIKQSELFPNANASVQSVRLLPPL